MSAYSLLALTGLAPRPGAADSEIDAAERALGVRLPDDYRAFLRESDGIEGFIAGSDQYLMLWRASELAPHNAGYRSAEYTPNFVIVGSNGGGDAYGFFRQNEQRLFFARIPFINSGLGEAAPMGRTLVEFVQRLRGDLAPPSLGEFDAARFEPVREALRRARATLPASAEKYRSVPPGRPGTVGTLDGFDEYMDQYEHEVALWALAEVGRAVAAPPEFWSSLDDAGRLMGFDEALRARECRP